MSNKDKLGAGIEKMKTKLVKRDKEGEVFEVILREYNNYGKLLDKKVVRGEDVKKYIDKDI